jgi:GT2 family glycosyltransferase
MTKTISFIIVCWNNKDIIGGCLQSIIDQDYEQKQIIVIDNDSSDDSVEYIQKNFPEVEILQMQANLGFAKANNIGIKHALKDDAAGYIALINSDATIRNDWAKTICEFADKKPRGAAFQTITLDYYNHDIIDSTHIYIARNGQGTQGSWRRRLPEDYEIAAQKTFGCNAAAAVFSRQFIETQPFGELFDETMFMYLEDVDVAARATVMGWDNYIVPGSRAYHMGSASSGKNPGFSLYMTYRNSLGMLTKNLPLGILLLTLPKLVVADFHTMRRLLHLKQKKGVYNLLKGRFVSLFFLPIYIGKRVKVKKNIDNKYLYQLMNRGY